MLDTGFPQADAENDFLRARRRQFLAALAHRLRGGRGDGNRLVRMDDVVGPLGWRGQRQLGLRTIGLESIAAAARQHAIDAYVTEVLTAVPPVSSGAPHRGRSSRRCPGPR